MVVSSQDQCAEALPRWYTTVQSNQRVTESFKLEKTTEII